MKFVSLNGYISEESNFISITVKGGNNNNSIGDQVWISNCGTRLEVLDYADDDVLQDAEELFEVGSRKAFKGALRRMNITY